MNCCSFIKLMFSILFFDPTARKMQQKQITVVSISEIKKYQLEKLRLHDVKKTEMHVFV